MYLKVQTEKGIETLILTNKEYNDLKLEMTGYKNYVQEYKTIDGKIITDFDIISIQRSAKI